VKGMNDIMQLNHSSTNLGLVISLGGSLLALQFSKKYHVAFGIMLTALAGVHSWQHRKSLTKMLLIERPSADRINLE